MRILFYECYSQIRKNKVMVSVPDGTAGNVTLTGSSVPADIQVGTSYLRLRLTTNENID